MAVCSSILAWKISMDRGAWQGYGPWDYKESGQAIEHTAHRLLPVEDLVLQAELQELDILLEDKSCLEIRVILENIV